MENYFRINSFIFSNNSSRESTPLSIFSSFSFCGYEIDFLLSRKNKLCPLEVKSSGHKTHASLDAFYHKFSGRILKRYLIYTKELRKDKDIVCLPFYMTMFL